MWDVSETRGSMKTPVAVYICLHSLDIFRLQCMCHGHGQDLDDIQIYHDIATFRDGHITIPRDLCH